MPTTPFVRDADNTIDLDTNYNQLNQKAKTLADDLVDYVEDQTQAAVGAVDTKIAELASVGDSTYTVDAVDIIAQAMPQSAFDAEAQAARDRYAGSGFVEHGWADNTFGASALIGKGLSTPATRNAAQMLYLGINYGTGQEGSKTTYPQFNVNGRLVKINAYAGEAGFFIVPNLPAPTVHSLPNRYDLVFLEAWDELISEKDWVVPRGCVQFLDTTYQGISLVAYGTASYSRYGSWDTSPTAGYGAVWSTLSKANKQTLLKNPENNIRLTPDGLVQTRYRIRVVQGPITGEPAVINVTTEYKYGSSNLIKPQGKRASIVEDSTLFDSNESGYYTGQAPSLGMGIWLDIGAFTAINQAANGLDTGNGYNGFCVALPIALVSRRNTGAFHPQYNPNGSARFLDTDTTTESLWYATDQTITSTADCFTHASGGAIADGAGSCGRPDGLYYDAIYSQDVKDLRYSAHKLELSSEQVNRTMLEDLQGFRRGYENPQSVLTAGTISYPSVRSNAPLRCDIIGDSAEYPASWATTPIMGHRLLTDEAGASYTPNGSRTVYKLRRRALAAPVLVLKGSTVMAVTTDWTFSTSTNAITFVVAPAATDVIQVFYQTAGALYASQVNAPMLALGEPVAVQAGNVNSRLDTLIGKVFAPTADPGAFYLGSVTNHHRATGILTGANFSPKHPATVAFGTNGSPSLKILPYISTVSGIAYLVLIFKELKHDGTDWGDDQKFVIADGFTTTTDDNSATVACGQASVELPYFVRS